MSQGNNTAIALSIVEGLMTNVVPVLMSVRQAQTEGRDLTDAELEQYFTADDVAKAKLEADIRARGG